MLQSAADARVAPRRVRQAIADSCLVLVVIGPSWVTIKNDKGQRRLDDPDDFVRMEVVEALRRSRPIISTCVQNASVPSFKDLPSEMALLARRSGIGLRHEHWDSDVEELLRGIGKYI